MNVLALYYELNNNIINIHAIINNKINKIHNAIIILYNIYICTQHCIYSNKIYFTSYNIIYNNYISNIIRKLNIYIWLIYESNLL